jgi:hypothetical protein
MTRHCRTARSAGLTALAAAAAIGSALSAGTAQADTMAVAAPGVVITQGSGAEATRCTLGYAARNSAGARLAITAGHCGTVGQQVYDRAHRLIGQYIAVRPDDTTTQRYGYSLIALADNVAASASVTPTFTVARQDRAAIGDVVCLFGTTSGRKCGPVAAATDSAGIISGSLSNPGDSGGPIVRMRDRALVGILIGHNSVRGETLFEPVTNILRLTAASGDGGNQLGPVVDLDRT